MFSLALRVARTYTQAKINNSYFCAKLEAVRDFAILRLVSLGTSRDS